MSQPESVPTNHPYPGTIKALFASGHVMLFGSLAFFVVLAKLYPEPYIHVYGLVAAHFVGGRMANAAAGLEMGFNKVFLLYQTVVQDYILMFYAFPFFIKGYKYFSKIPWFGPSLESAHQLALKHRATIRPYGIAGLLIFVVFPFWGTGPLVGVFAGYMLGFSTVLNFGTVMIGNLMTAAAYIWAYDYIRVRLEAYNENLSLYLLGVVIAIILISAIIGYFYQKRTAVDVTAPAMRKDSDDSDD